MHLSWEIEMDLKEKLIILNEDYEITKLDIELYSTEYIVTSDGHNGLFFLN